MLLLNERGEIVRLGAPLTTPGGEGAVYEVPSDPSLLAKIYHQPATPERAAKLQHQARSAKPELLAIAAWPKMTLFDQSNPRMVRGFLMPRMPGKEIHHLYGPRNRQSQFPAAAWDFLIKVARNCAASFETLHENNILMADVNERNLLVKSDGTVVLIDCDSYQISNGHGHFLCDAGVPLWTPPELQGKNFRGLVRTANHDRFGLAVLIFELLFMGRHPYAGVPTGGKHYEIEDAIREFLFAFSSRTWPRGVKSPPHALPLKAVPEKLARLFERAFLAGSEQLGARPTGREWANELDGLHASKKTCNIDTGHKFWNGLTECPWCQILGGGGPNFFISVAIHAGVSGLHVDVSAFWATIQRVATGDLMQKQAASPPLPGVKSSPMPCARPQPSRLSKPQPPTPPEPMEPPVVEPPTLPDLPVMPPPARLPAQVMGRSESIARVSLLGIVFFGVAGCLFFDLDLIPAAIGAGWGALVCVIVLFMKGSQAKGERARRKSAERKAREDERAQAAELHACAIEEYEMSVQRILHQQANSVATAEAAYQRECQKRQLTAAQVESAKLRGELAKVPPNASELDELLRRAQTRVAELEKQLLVAQADSRKFEDTIRQREVGEFSVRRELTGLPDKELRRVIFLVDTSTSMRNSPAWASARKLMRTWLEFLPVEECVLVSFNDKAIGFPKDGYHRVRQPDGAKLTEQREELLRVFDQAPQGTYTDLLLGLRRAYEYPAADVIVLFTDGHPHVGYQPDPSFAQDIFKEAAKHPRIPVLTVALGSYEIEGAGGPRPKINAPVSFLKELARQTGGNFLAR